MRVTKYAYEGVKVKCTTALPDLLGKFTSIL